MDMQIVFDKQTSRKKRRLQIFENIAASDDEEEKVGQEWDRDVVST